MTSEETEARTPARSSALKDTPGPADEAGMTSAHPAKIVLFATVVLVGSAAVMRDGAGLLGLGLVVALLLTAKARR